jgi:enoyl-[acyl-carrier protein] reductase I
MGFLAGKRILITGLLSNRSISYGIAKAMHREGAELAFTYQNERFQDRVAKMAAEFGSSMIFPCDVQNDEIASSSISSRKMGRSRRSGSLHRLRARRSAGRRLPRRTLPRSLPHLPGSQRLQLPRPRQGRAADDEGPQGSLLTMSYLGAVRTMPNYNIMGMAKASLEAAVRYMAVTSAPKAPASMPFPPARSRPSRPPASAASASCWPSTSAMRRCAATSPSRKSATPPPSCAPIWPAV